MVLKLPKMVHFLQVCPDLSQKSKSIKEIYLYLYERTNHALSENSVFCGGRNNGLRDIIEQNIKRVLTQQNFNRIHQLLTLTSSKL